jgi:hypothetical protein
VHGQTFLKVDPCDLPGNYIPDTLGYTPLKRVRLVLHIFAKADSSGNFRNLPEDRDFIQRILNHMDWYYRETEPLRNPAPAYYHISDTRIRPVVDTIIWHYDDDAWNFKKYVTYYEAKTKDSTGYSLSAVSSRCEQLYQKFVRDDKTLSSKIRDSALNIFFLEVAMHQDKGMAENLGSKRWAYFTGAYYHFLDKEKAWWCPGLLMAHEIAHTLGLSHPFDFSSCEDLPLGPKGSTNDLMDAYPNQGRALTPCQMGQMHSNLMGHMFGGNIGDALIRDWCTYHPNETMTIRPGDTVVFKSPHYLWGDLVIESGATLIVKCELSMPPGSEIRVKKGGALIVDGGKIFQQCGGKWKGIKLEARERFLGIFKRRSQAVLEITNGGAVNDADKTVADAKF